jgi:hypothetical protein
MCSMLYQLSGKCNANLKATEFNNVQDGYAYDENGDAYGSYKQMYQSYAQYQNEQTVCSFISSLNSNSYDKNGQVYLDSNGWAEQWRNPSNWQQEFNMESEAMTAGKKAALILMAFATTAMAVFACWLHGSLARKNIPWRPKRKIGEDPTDLSRQNSGIGVARSRSGQASAPLI